MAKTVDQHSTVENFRTRYNELATDVGDISGLRTDAKGNIIDALNSIEDKSFFFQEFIYTATSSQTAFTGNDAFGNSLVFKKDRILVYKQGLLLRSGDDYTITNVQSDGTYKTLTLGTGATTGDKVSIFAFTGSFLTVQGGGSGGSSLFTETAANTIFNHNSAGIILNANASPSVTQLDSGVGIQLEGVTKVDGNLTVDTGHTLSAPTITDGTATITGGVGTGFSSITSTTLTGNVTGDLTGDVTGNVSGSSSLATSITATANNSANETVYPTFVDGATGTQGIETDTGLTYNPSTGMLTTTAVTATFTGNITGNVTGNASGTAGNIANHAMSGLSDVNYTTTPSDGQILAWDNANSYWEPVNQATSDTVTEGSSNLYFTHERVLDFLSGTSTTGEGLIAGTGITLAYNDGANTLTITGQAQYGDENVLDFLGGGGLVGGNGIDLVYADGSNTLTIHSDIESGNGLVATVEATGENTLAVGPGKGVLANANDVALDYEVVNSAPSGVGSTADGHLWFVV